MSANESYANATSHGATTGAAAVAGLARLAAGWFEALWRGYKLRRTIAAMSDLDSHTLRDIGVERWDIALVARAAVDGRVRGRPRPRWSLWSR